MIAGLLFALLAARTVDQGVPNAAAPLEQAIAAAESSLREAEPQAAESRYRSALFEGWMLLGTLERIDGALPAAREAFRNASASAVDDRRAIQALALVDMQRGETDEAVALLNRLAARDAKDVLTRRLLAQALVARGRDKEALAELEQARGLAPRDLELAFALAAQYLRVKKTDQAASLFAEIAKARPIPPTHVLIGRTYRDAGELERARAELQTALKLDPRAPRAHYYLGVVALKEGGRAGLETAIAEFQAERKRDAQDSLANLELGVALVESQRPAEALPPLEIAARAVPPSARIFYYLGRAQMGADRGAEGVASLKRALALAREQGANTQALRGIHLQLAEALRKVGEIEEASQHFAESRRFSEENTDAERADMARYLADVPEAETATHPIVPMIEASPLAARPPAERLGLKRQATVGLARAYLNLGVLQAQGERFPRAAELIAKAAAVDPDFPNVQSSLGVAHFNAKQFQQAVAPLTRALAKAPADAGLKRMLAMAWLNTRAYEKAAELLQDDPERATNPSLQFAYGLALVKTDRAAEAERVFDGLISRHGGSAELNVLLGQAHAQQGDFEEAIRSLQRALQIDGKAAEANSTLGEIYLRQGRLDEAEQALRAELLAHPDHLPSQQNLAIVLDRQQKPQEAIPLLQSVLKANPDVTDARYQLGKILLAQGAAAEAVEHLEAAVRLAPEDANIRYQLGQAYQKLGRRDRAEQEFEAFRQLKARR